MMSGTVPDFVLYLPVALAIIGIIYGIFVALSIFKKSEGTAKMIKISGSIREGADAYLKRQFRTIALFAVALAIVVYLALGPLVAIAFVVGAVALLIVAVLVFGSGALFSQSHKYVLFFNGSVKGLSVGAPVIFRGVKIGNVVSINLVYDEQTQDVLIPVVIEVELSRVMGIAEKPGYPDYVKFIKQGLRAKLEIQNFITGQLMIALDFYPDKPAKFYGIMKNYPELPALPISPDIFHVMDDIPVKEITVNLEQAVAGINRLVNSEGISELGKTLKEVTNSARSFGLFAEYLEQHPEALLKGKSVPKGEK